MYHISSINFRMQSFGSTVHFRLICVWDAPIESGVNFSDYRLCLLIRHKRFQYAALENRFECIFIEKKTNAIQTNP